MARGFTLVELLVVIGILAILAAMSQPIVQAGAAALGQTTASATVRQLGTASAMYQADHDDTFVLAMYQSGIRRQTWFGLQDGPYTYDSKKGLLSGYTNGHLTPDSTHQAEDYMGDQTGFGYNYGYLGSDFHVTESYLGWPNCRNPATGGEVGRPSQTLVFATSAFRFVE